MHADGQPGVVTLGFLVSKESCWEYFKHGLEAFNRPARGGEQRSGTEHPVYTPPRVSGPEPTPTDAHRTLAIDFNELWIGALVT